MQRWKTVWPNPNFSENEAEVPKDPEEEETLPSQEIMNTKCTLLKGLLS